MRKKQDNSEDSSKPESEWMRGEVRIKVLGSPPKVDDYYRMYEDFQPFFYPLVTYSVTIEGRGYYRPEDFEG